MSEWRTAPGSGRRAGRNPEPRRRILLTAVMLAAVLAATRAFEVAVLEGERWRVKALDQQGDTLTVPAPRGTIYDRDGVPLAASQEVFSIALAPREMADRAAVATLLRRHLGITPAAAGRYVEVGRTWVVLPGRYGVEVREALDGVHGIHFERVLQRFYPNGSLARELLGPVRTDGIALGGLELEFDSVLSGRPGLAVARRDARQRPLPGPMVRAVEPVPGRDIHLTIDYDLQQIADQALADAIERTGASGGEMLLTDPRTGEVLAAVSRGRDGRARNWRAVTDPYEPGSTLKPFTVAGLLSLGRATLADSVHGEDGSYERLRLTDVSAHQWITLATALRRSSNIGVAKMAERMTRAEQYATLRAFGFGTPTAATYPSESGGRLPRPAQWTFTSPSRLAIGYEMSATPLQMALAYGALANGGVLMEPRLVREVRSRDGRVERALEPRSVRRVVPAEVAAAVRGVLMESASAAVDEAAEVDRFEVAGKTGTARMTVNGRYRPGAYRSSFAGFFPARDPQLVFVVKLDEPQGEYYGAIVAAPVTRATLEAALAAHSTPIDRAPMSKPSQLAAVMDLPAQTPPPTGTQVLTFGGAQTPGAPVAAPPAVVPDVAGMSVRDGVHRLHAAGFRVRLEGNGRVLRTVPVAGTEMAAAAVVRVICRVAG